MNHAHHIAFANLYDRDHRGLGVLRSLLALSIHSLRTIAILNLILISLLHLIIY